MVFEIYFADGITKEAIGMIPLYSGSWGNSSRAGCVNPKIVAMVGALLIGLLSAGFK